MNIGVIKFYVWVEMRLSCMFGLKSVLGNMIRRFRHHTIHGRLHNIYIYDIYKYTYIHIKYIYIFIHISYLFKLLSNNDSKLRFKVNHVHDLHTFALYPSMVCVYV